MERSLRQSLLMSGGHPAIFVSRPISVGLLVAAGLFLVYSSWSKRRALREAAA
jgi:TctA family transporter